MGVVNSMINIVWFRRDFRVQDNPALHAAVTAVQQQGDSACGKVLPVYIYAPEEEAPWQPGAASRCWLHHSLESLRKDLAALDMPLLLLKGPSAKILAALSEACDAPTVYWNRLYEPACIARDTQLKADLSERGIASRSFNGSLLIEPWELSTKAGTPFRVFTPFWKAANEQLRHEPSTVLPIDNAALTAVAVGASELESVQRRLGVHSCHGVEDFELLPSLDWHRDMMAHWQVGERAAQTQLQQFLQSAIEDYDADRDIPAVMGTSMLSPHLHFGEISPRQVWAAIRSMPLPDSEAAQSSIRRYLAELGWREFAHHLLFHFPHTAEQSLNPKYHYFPWWRSDSEQDNSWQGSGGSAALSCWQRGETGVSLVDAGMQELWQRGWMHNRVRMVAASFLCKNLGVHWIEGARWFWDTLVDANLANNTLGWQWAAGCGADAAPYFRIFNPDTQAQRFDPEAEYRHHWLVKGWEGREAIVDLRESRKQALEAYAYIKDLSIDAKPEA